ncbi:MAG: hypothetical protein IJ744_04105 [Lachnospiraceae bacterium]|nr:hypothetical protein [Lachnospiraceae bacterium]
MAEEKKKRRSRRAYLNDFHLNEKGEYVYEGKMIGLVGDESTYRQYLTVITVMSFLILGFTVAAECLPAVTLSKFGLTVIPWLGQLITASLVIYAAWKILWGKNPMREYIYKASAEKLPTRLLLTAAFSFFTAAEETIYILVNGCAGEVLFTVLRPVFSLVCGILAVLLYQFVKKTEWKEIAKANPDTP